MPKQGDFWDNIPEIERRLENPDEKKTPATIDLKIYRFLAMAFIQDLENERDLDPVRRVRRLLLNLKRYFTPGWPKTAGQIQLRMFPPTRWSVWWGLLTWIAYVDGSKEFSTLQEATDKLHGDFFAKGDPDGYRFDAFYLSTFGTTLESRYTAMLSPHRWGAAQANANSSLRNSLATFLSNSHEEYNLILSRYDAAEEDMERWVRQRSNLDLDEYLRNRLVWEIVFYQRLYLNQ
jgi:hypothetical protein